MPTDGIKKTIVTIKGKLLLLESLIVGKDKNDQDIQYDLYQLFEEFDGEHISLSIAKERLIVPLNAMKGVRKDAVQNSAVPAESEEAEPVFGSREPVSDIR